MSAANESRPTNASGAAPKSDSPATVSSQSTPTPDTDVQLKHGLLAHHVRDRAAREQRAQAYRLKHQPDAEYQAWLAQQPMPGRPIGGAA